MLSFVFETCLFRVGEIQLGRQVYDLELHNVLLVGERLRHLPQHIWSNLRHVLAVLSDQPQDAGPRHRHLQTVWEGMIPCASCGHSAGGAHENHTWMLSVSFAMCLMMSLCFSGCICSSFLMTTTDSATTSSVGGHVWKPAGVRKLCISRETHILQSK